MTVMRNLLVGANDEERARYLMRKLGIEHLASEPAHKLSGGETARMALARLLMRDRQLLIVDEPTAAMDMESVTLAERLLAEYREKPVARSCLPPTVCVRPSGLRKNLVFRFRKTR